MICKKNNEDDQENNVGDGNGNSNGIKWQC